jgi:hypothetical protein
MIKAISKFLILSCALAILSLGLYGCEQVDKESLNRIIQDDSSF